MKLGELILCDDKRLAEIIVSGITCNSKEVEKGEDLTFLTLINHKFEAFVQYRDCFYPKGIKVQPTISAEH